jgi:hypothetical protein
MPEPGVRGAQESAVHSGQSFLHEEGAGIAAAVMRSLASPVEVQRYLGGTEYPALRQVLYERARQQQAPERVLTTIGQMPDQTYRSVIDVTRELGRLSPHRFAAALTRPSPALVLAHLKGISFPASKQQIMERAAAENAPLEVMEALERIPEQTYARIVEINKQLRRAP